MTITEILEKYNISMAELGRELDIPYRTIQNWKAGINNPPEYVLKLIGRCLQKDHP